MNNRIMNKLRSRSGASITFALLLFLVCSVLCAVIFAAATSASGRMSSLPESDQRYFAVASAAELLKKMLNGKTASIVRVEKTEITTTVNANGTLKEEQTDHSIKFYIVADKEAGEITDSDIENGIDADNNPTTNSINKDAALRLYKGLPLPTDRKLSLTANGSGADSVLAVSIEETIEEDGSVTLKLYNTNNSSGSASSGLERCTMVMYFRADTSEIMRSKTTTEPQGTSNAIKTTTTDYTIKTFKWTLTGIKTISG